MYAIENDKKPANLRSHVKTHYPFADLKIGQSFFVPVGVRELSALQISLTTLLARYCLKNQKPRGEYITRRETHEGQKGVRVHRVATEKPGE